LEPTPFYGDINLDFYFENLYFTEVSYNDFNSSNNASKVIATIKFTPTTLQSRKFMIKYRP